MSALRVRPLLPREAALRAAVLALVPAGERGFYAELVERMRGRHYVAERGGALVGYGGVVPDPNEALGAGWLSLLLGEAGAEGETARLVVMQLQRASTAMGLRVLLADDGCVVSRDAARVLEPAGFRTLGAVRDYFGPALDQRYYLWSRTEVPSAAWSEPLARGAPRTPRLPPGVGLHPLDQASVPGAVALVERFSRDDAVDARSSFAALAGGASWGRLFVARGANGVLGVAGWSANALRPTAGLYWNGWFYVDEAARGGGLAWALMDAVVSSCREAGGRKLLATPSAGPRYARARGFYVRYGFRPEVAIPGYYGPGEAMWLLGLDL